MTPRGEEEFTCKTAKTVAEATALIEAGFQYITEMEGLKIFKKKGNNKIGACFACAPNGHAKTKRNANPRVSTSNLTFKK
jgi:hypothetical protein